ncbi:hypothetical protein Glove_475g22 [Diversispora epigaea]|uniref:Uncharacterized protein n=1 Tax=Diversispora epigaea TaxID=1348612 RepID=A0A397GL15_9GLOM|nr:hypothetical protein Glove_475g22 [Diversispora epigaea]
MPRNTKKSKKNNNNDNEKAPEAMVASSSMPVSTTKSASVSALLSKSASRSIATTKSTSTSKLKSNSTSTKSICSASTLIMLTPTASTQSASSLIPTRRFQELFSLMLKQTKKRKPINLKGSKFYRSQIIVMVNKQYNWLIANMVVMINKGFYPSNNILKYTFSRSGDNTQYKLPDQYLIHTSWGRGKSKHTIKCEINYINTLPIFKIGFGDGFQTCIESIKSATDVANKYLHIKNSNTKTRLSGIHVFGLNGQELEREREKKYQSRFLKPFNMLDNTMKIKRVRKFGELILDSFNNVVKSSFHPDDNFALDLEKENKKNEAFLKVIDQGPIARDSYQSLTALLPKLPRENTIYTVKKNINEEMANKISISILNISNFSSFNLINENLNINNSEVEEEVLKYVGKAGYHRVTDILIYIIPGLVKRKILNNSIINLRISGDGCNVGRKLKHVMITFTILDDTLNL